MTDHNEPPKRNWWDRLNRTQQLALLGGGLVALLVMFGIIGTVSEDQEAVDDAVTSQESPTESPSPSGSPAPTDDDEQTDDSDAAASSCEGFEDPTSGRPLCEFEDSTSFPERVRLARDVDNVLASVQEVAPWTEQQDLTDLYSTCDDLERGLPAADITANAVLRFSGGPDEQIDDAGADRLVELARQDVCANE